MEDAENQVSEVGKEKDTLELEKLRLEIRRLQHPIRASLREFAWKDLAAIVVATAGILLAWVTGVFSVAKEHLAVSTERLQIEKAHLEEGNLELARTRTTLQADKQKLEEEVLALRNETGAYKRETAAIKAIASIRATPAGVPPKHDVWAEVALTDGGEGYQIAVYRPVHRVNSKSDPDVIIEPRVSEVIDRLQEIPRLVSLKIRNFELSQKDVQKISQLRQLRVLGLHRNHLSDEMLEPLSGMTKLTDLNVTGNNVKRPRVLARLSNLKYLTLRKTLLDDEGLALLRPLSHTLLGLWLTDTPITDIGVTQLNEFRALNTLCLIGTRVTPAGFDQLNLPELRYLVVNLNQLPEPHWDRLHKRLAKLIVNPGPDRNWAAEVAPEKGPWTVPPFRDYGDD